MRWCLLPVLFAANIAAAQVVVEYNVRIEEEISPDRRAALPQKVFIATNGQRVMVRGIWATPSNSYQLYLPEERVFYHLDIDGTAAVKYDFLPIENTSLTMAPPEIIAGVYCNMALAVEGKDTFPIFYTDAFGLWFCQIAEVPGFAMRYTKRLQGIKVTYEAVKYYFEAIPEDMYDLGSRKIVESNNLPDSRQWALQIGRKPPKIKGACMDGTRFNAKDHAGKVLVVDVNGYESPGAPYLRELYWFNSLAQQYAGMEDAAFLSISLHDEEFLRNYVTRDEFAFKVMPDGAFYKDAFRMDWLPATIVINRYGRVAEYVIGHGPDSEVRLRRAIDLALKGGLKPAGLD